jgi:amidase
MTADLTVFSSAAEQSRRVQAREISVRELVEAQLARIAAHNPRLNAIVTLDAEGALARARAADAALARGQSWGPLHGVPFTLKDCHSTAGMRTTVGAPQFKDYVPVEDGTVAARLKAAGGILLGKTNVPPMLTRAQTDNPIFGRTNNPWNLERTVGGSSGGSAAAVAAGLCAFDVGSDMSGSIRIPSHFCGVFGLKPSANRVPNTGHIPPPPGLGNTERTMPTSGPIARSAEDLALVLRVLIGPDGRDYDVPPVPWREAQPRTPDSLRIAFMPEFPGVPTARAVRAAVERTASELQRAGARVDEREPGWSIAQLNEVWREYFGAAIHVIGELMGGKLPLAVEAAPPPTLTHWQRLLLRRDALALALDALLDEYDAFLTPVSISTAFPHSPPGTPIPVDGVPVNSRFVDHYLYPFNMLGHPAVAVPAGVADDGLPVGVQLVGKRWQDEKLIAVAAAIAQITGGYRSPADAS